MQPESVSTTNAEIEPDRTTPGTANRKGFRFSLKWLFLLIAILCAGLGAYAILERQAREMLARHEAILAAIEDGMTAEPHDANFVNPQAVRRSKDEITKRRSAPPDPRRRQVSRVFGGRNFYATEISNTQLDVTNALAAPNAQNIPLNLIGHYGKGLANLGLKQTYTMTGPSPTAIWQMPEHGVDVLIDVNLDPPAKRANVRVIFIQNDRASIW